MKLLIVLSIIACGYADKLDRAYLPPVTAATAGGSPGALIAPGGSSVSRPGSSLGQSNQVDFGQGLPVRQPGNGAGPSRQSSFSGISGSGRPVFGSNQSPNGINKGSNEINQFPSTLAGSKNQLLGANAPFGTSQGQTFGSTISPGASTFNVGSQQTYLPPSEGLSSQTFGQQSSSVAQTFKPERAQAAADRNAETLKYVNDNNGESYLYSYETSNGITAEESGVATNGVKAQGGYSYTGDDGQAYSLTYTADENGFQPQGEHLPTPHPIPEEILKSIEENSKAAAAGTQEGAYRPEEYENESSAQQYNVGQFSVNRPQSQGQGSFGASYSQIPTRQTETNAFSGNQGIVRPNSGQSEQFSETRPSQSSNQFGGSERPINQYQQGSGYKGVVEKTPGQSAQISRPNQFDTQFLGQSNQYQTGVGSSQDSFGQSSNQGATSQGSGQILKGSSGYNYNQPQSAFGSATQFGSSASVQNRPQGTQGQITASTGPGNNQDTFGIQSGKVPSSETSFGFSQGSQFGKPQNSLNKAQNRPTGSEGVFALGQQNKFNVNKPSLQPSQGSQVRPSGQASTESTVSSGYQYQKNEDRPSFSLNRPGGTSFQTSQGSQYQPNANKPFTTTSGIKDTTQFGSSQAQQQNGNRPFSGNTGSNQGASPIGGSSGPTGSSGYQYYKNEDRPSLGLNRPSGTSFQTSQGSQYQPNANKPFGTTSGFKDTTQFGSTQAQQQNGNRPFSGFNQGALPLGGSSGIKKTESGSFFGQTNRPSVSNIGPNQSAAQFGLGSQQFTSAQDPKGSDLTQAPYQYNRPGQSFPPQQQTGSRPGGSFSGSQGFNSVRPDVSSQGSAGQRPGVSSPVYQEISGQQSSFNSQGSQGINGRPGFTGIQGGSGQRPDGNLSGLQGTSGQGDYSKSPSVTGQQPGSSFQPINDQRPFSSSSGPQGYNGQSTSAITQSTSVQRPTGGSSVQGNKGRPEQFGGPRQPPSFNPQEGYKY